MSRTRSAPAARSAARTPARGGGAARGGARGVYVSTPQSDIYVVLLGISLGAILLGCLLLALHLNAYEFALKAT